MRSLLTSLCLLACISLIGCKPTAASSADDTVVTAFLHRYFDTWSARDMDGYSRCFDESARIAYVAASGQVISQAKTDFIHGQKLAHEQALTPMKEVPLEMKIQGDDKVKQAAVTWVLTKGSTKEQGTDFFTLKRDGADWKIVSLVFYGE